jgi:beta-lactamase class A
MKRFSLMVLAIIGVIGVVGVGILLGLTVGLALESEALQDEPNGAYEPYDAHEPYEPYESYGPYEQANEDYEPYEAYEPYEQIYEDCEPYEAPYETPVTSPTFTDQPPLAPITVPDRITSAIELTPELNALLTAELAEFMAQFGDTVSVHFENLATGFVFQHYADRVFFGASATKAPFALYIYDKARRGLTNLDAVLTFTEADFWEGSGSIRHNYEYGATFTQRRLLHLMIAPSDNIATRILRRTHGLAGYREFIANLGGNTAFIQNITYSYLSAAEAGFYMREIFRFIDVGDQYAQEFKQNLLRNRYPFIIADYPVASKSGWAENFGGAWHDMAIVFAPSPYILALLSNLPGGMADRAVYNQISRFMQDFNTRWFTE